MKTFADFGIQVSGHGQVSTTCPKCSHQRKKKNDLCLSVNVEKGVWQCHHCGWNGGLANGKAEFTQNACKPKERAKLEFKFDSELTEEAYAYLVDERCISEYVLQRNQVCVKDGVIQFPFFKNGECVNIKFRSLSEKKFWQSKNGEKILYGYDDIDSTKTIIVEGEFDKLALEVSGFKNVVSVPDGAPALETKSYSSKFDFLENCREKLDHVDEFILAVDNDPPGKKLEQELVRRLGPERCSRVVWPEGIKDANQMLIEQSSDGLAKLIESAIPYPVSGITWAKDIDLEGFYKSGFQSGLEPGWVGLDPLYRISQESGDLHIVTGVPSHGKSEWLDALLINLAESEGWNFGIFSPENYPLEYHSSKLIEKYIGKPFREGFRARMTKEEMVEGKKWLNQHFMFLNPEEDSVTVDAILSLAKVLVYRCGIKGLVIDPWNEIDHSRPSAMTETEYISQSLTKIRRFARLHSVHVWLVAHPTKLSKEPNGMFPVPSPYDISGSAHWRNKADCCIAVWRNLDPNNNSNEVEIHVQKIRKKHLGRLGLAKLKYEYATGRYF